MLSWIVTWCTVLFTALLGSSGYVAVFVRDAAQRADAYRVLKLLTGIIAGAGGGGGLLQLVVKLHGLGPW
ncbi:hypothetical protein ABZ342_16545 [Amycolatopsis sp. NPDC005961]|uniref:Uncharacterized protein n=1 Tax=Amycolatopsis camponoti TaxID=2606593 RepID=A0A6I8LTH1_9PSEU|nr:hypothetical protein [Amycolatopsis camponoti]VVJ18766.1 Uncharacterised protein [Amycolatopsis camponoti]